MAQKQTRSLKIRFKKRNCNYLSSKNKGADQLCSYPVVKHLIFFFFFLRKKTQRHTILEKSQHDKV